MKGEAGQTADLSLYACMCVSLSLSRSLSVPVAPPSPPLLRTPPQTGLALPQAGWPLTRNINQLGFYTVGNARHETATGAQHSLPIS
jgi:hypothetical protein